MDLELPKSKDSMDGLKSIVTNFEIVLFLIMMFVCGIMYGFVETFLFVFLKVGGGQEYLQGSLLTHQFSNGGQINNKRTLSVLSFPPALYKQY